MKRSKSSIEETIVARVRQFRYPEPEREYLFHPSRRFRFDFAFPSRKIAIEAEGGVWIKGRHNRGSGFVADCSKYNQAAILGWRILRYTTSNLNELIPDMIALFGPTDQTRAMMKTWE